MNVLNCSGIACSVWKFGEFCKQSFKIYQRKLTNSPLALGISTFISDDLELTISTARESLERYIWQPSVLSIEMVGTLPKTWWNQNQVSLHFLWNISKKLTCIWTLWQLTNSMDETTESKSKEHFLHESKTTLLTFPLTVKVELIHLKT